MISLSRLGFAALVLTGSLTASSSAFAWGCIAVSDEGSYGYSYNYDNEDSARAKALNECAANTTVDSVCEITECDDET